MGFSLTVCRDNNMRWKSGVDYSIDDYNRRDLNRGRKQCMIRLARDTAEWLALLRQSDTKPPQSEPSGIVPVKDGVSFLQCSLECFDGWNVEIVKTKNGTLFTPSPKIALVTYSSPIEPLIVRLHPSFGCNLLKGRTPTSARLACSYTEYFWSNA